MLSLKNHIELQEETQELAEICLNLIDDFIEENYDLVIDESVESEYVDDTILNIIVTHFVENQNDDELYEEMSEVMLNELVGSAIASARYGLKARATRKDVSKRERKYQGLVRKQMGDPKLYTSVRTPTGIDINPVYRKKSQEHQRKITTGAYGTGIAGSIKKKLGERDVAKSQDRYEKAQQQLRVARQEIGLAKAKRTRTEKNKASLKYKIDQAIKHPVKTIVKGVAKGIYKGVKKLF